MGVPVLLMGAALICVATLGAAGAASIGMLSAFASTLGTAGLKERTPPTRRRRKKSAWSWVRWQSAVKVQAGVRGWRARRASRGAQALGPPQAREYDQKNTHPPQKTHLHFLRPAVEANRLLDQAVLVPLLKVLVRHKIPMD